MFLFIKVLTSTALWGPPLTAINVLGIADKSDLSF